MTAARSRRAAHSRDTRSIEARQKWRRSLLDTRGRSVLGPLGQAMRAMCVLALLAGLGPRRRFEAGTLVRCRSRYCIIARDHISVAIPASSYGAGGGARGSSRRGAEAGVADPVLFALLHAYARSVGWPQNDISLEHPPDCPAQTSRGRCVTWIRSRPLKTDHSRCRRLRSGRADRSTLPTFS